jgi:hypothetical protein
MSNKWNEFASITLGAICLIGVLSACSSPTPSPTPTAMPTATALPSATLAPQPTQVVGTPSPEGMDLVITYCTSCHTLDRITSAHKTYEQWAELITHKVTL